VSSLLSGLGFKFDGVFFVRKTDLRIDTFCWGVTVRGVRALDPRVFTCFCPFDRILRAYLGDAVFDNSREDRHREATGNHLDIKDRVFRSWDEFDEQLPMFESDIRETYLPWLDRYQKPADFIIPRPFWLDLPNLLGHALSGSDQFGVLADTAFTELDRIGDEGFWEKQGLGDAMRTLLNDLLRYGPGLLLRYPPVDGTK
jgi:hypothetical protein